MVQRDGHHAIDLCNQIPPSGGHHARHGAGQIVPVFVFQPMDEAARHIVIERHRARAGEDGRLCEGLRRDQTADSKIDREGKAKSVAQGLVDEPKTGPAGGAKGPGIGGGRAAPRTGRRIDEAECGGACPPPKGSGAPEGAATMVGKGVQRTPAGWIACWSAARALAFARIRPTAQPAAAPAKPWWPA